jgi:hypothetical protein
MLAPLASAIVTNHVGSGHWLLAFFIWLLMAFHASRSI